MNMDNVTRREAIKVAAASVAAAVMAGAATSDIAAAGPSGGAGPCTLCSCTGFGIGNGNTCNVSGCRHAYSAHTRIHPAPQSEEVYAAAAASFSVAYTYYKKKNGKVTKISSGKVGPYTTRQEAQSVVDQYLGDDKTDNGVRYYYAASITNSDPS
jgi:hypothetical protein